VGAPDQDNEGEETKLNPLEQFKDTIGKVLTGQAIAEDVEGSPVSGIARKLVDTASSGDIQAADLIFRVLSFKAVFVLALVVGFALPSRAQNLTTVSAANITDLNGAKLAAGQLCFLGTDQNDTPISFQQGGGGQVLKRQFCSGVAAGVVTSFTVPNPANTLPSGIYYRVTVKDSSTGVTALQYTGVTFAGGTFNFDNYTPVIAGANLAPLTGNTVSGNLGVTGNLSVTGSFSPGSVSTGAITGSSAAISGAITGKSIGGVQYAAAFAGASTTCGIAEAYTALPSSGGEIVLQQGNCSAAGWPVTISKPILLVGQGMGGPTDPGTNATCVGGSVIQNTSTGGNFFNISLGAGTSLEGVTFRDFCMLGNKAVGGATAGDCVDINGGTTAQQLRAIAFENIQCNQPKGSGFVMQDNAFIISFNNVHVDQSGSHCYVIKAGPNSGATSQIHFIASVGDLCGGSNASFLPGTADGWNISGTGARTVDIIASTLADSNNGINVVTGAINTNIHVTHSDFETNTTCDINLNDGFGHVIIGSTLFGTGVGARGVCTAMPAGAAVQPNQLLMYGNNINSHTVQDVTIGANQKTGFILPQSANNYSYSDASGHVVKLDVNQFGILTFAGAEFAPATNGVTASGDSSAAWSDVFTFFIDATTYRPRATGHLLISDTAPTISAGFGTSPSIVNQNGTAVFTVNVGTGGTATSGVIGLPTATNGWYCTCEDQTTTSATVNRCKQTANTTTTATIGNFNTTPAAAAWVASDILNVSCYGR
jgi:hypothetical protein